MPDGYFYEESVLSSVSSMIGQASDQLSRAINPTVGAVDAGTSSSAVSQALARVCLSGRVIAATLGEVSEGVNATKGSYAHIENTNEGLFQLSKRGHIDFPGQQSGDLGKLYGSLLDGAEDPDDPEDLKNRHAPLPTPWER